MAAPVILIGDDEDEFDWEAAVQEIDVACQNTAGPVSSYSFQPPPTYASPVWAEKRGISKSLCGQLNGLHKNSRQSTLDQFINRDSATNSNSHTKKGKEPEIEARIKTDVKDSFVEIDPEAAKTWIYPVAEKIPLREYQLNITKKALFSNTMVALPTGLGKTLIAAVVMYNYFRWFPEGKIVFSAPSRPLVVQQIKACHNVVGIPQEWTIDMTGQTAPAKRRCLWKEKRVFFVTPQVFEKDIQSGACLVQYLVCLVIDEAHRATGNYSYCVAVRELMDVPVQLRILALTATPGSKQQAIQHVIDNLQISTLEYRIESDPDVAPYVHHRKLELIEVPMGQDALEINNLLLDVIRPMAARLFKLGVLPNRDFQTLSPHDFLTSRDKFRQAPPPDLSHVKCQEVEGCFGVLISLYHMRKLLSSHGIKPACEMLEDKLKQGSFARLMSNNEPIHQMKVLMKRSMSHGAPSPKLSKLIEVLVDHFKNNDPERSRVIIFSNFRGSVRDIIDALSNLGNFVRPAEFIGQSSGKILKGQTQKIQQAVLEKFRKGEYNVIVATCIGEEGLDIMEVDLVICFDANISSVRMIQRMGRTGRKHDGRVVILACEGPEMKGYMRKQAINKTVSKHMRNGGMNSFNFHPSPRMVPHIYKPEQRCLELSIPVFVHRGKKVKDDSVPVLNFEEKLTDAEALKLARYFPDKDSTWKPSLIAYPQFQAFPSRVHMVKHSSRTVLLIDSMQHLQGQSCTWNNPSCDFEYPDQRAAVESIEKVNNIEEEWVEVSNAELSSCTLDTEMLSVPTSPEEPLGTTSPALGSLLGKGRYIEPASIGNVLDAVLSKEHLPVPNVMSIAPCRHLSFFSSELASVDSCGRVLIAPVPMLDVKEILYSKSPIARNSILLNCPGQVSVADSEAVSGDAKELLVQTTVFASLGSPVEGRCENVETMAQSQSPVPSKIKPVLKTQEGSCLGKTRNVVIPGSPEFLDSSSEDEEEPDLSPRLTNFIKSGCVPESPINGGDKEDSRITGIEPEELDLSPRVTSFIVSGCVPESPINGFSGVDIEDNGITGIEPEVLVTSCAIPKSLKADEDEGTTVIRSPCTPVLKAAKNSINTEGSCEVSKEFRTPLANLTNSTCSKDWCMSSGEKSVGAKRTCKFKRLRKVGDKRSCNGVEENTGKYSMNHPGKFTSIDAIVPLRRKRDKGRLETVVDARDLILVEAEVSSEVEVSADEEDDQNDDTYEDSFIDDRVDPTMATQENGSEVDMLAIYRRSLLSQSPIRRQQKHSSCVTPDSSVSETSLNSFSETETSLQTPQSSTRLGNLSSKRKSVCSKLEKIAEEAMPSTSGTIHIDDIDPTQRRKRKLSCNELHVPAVNLEKEFSSHSASIGKASSLQGEANENDPTWNFYTDDEFYESLDLDALEAQAAKLLEEKAVSSSRKESASKPIQPKGDIMDFPSFDLGIS